MSRSRAVQVGAIGGLAVVLPAGRPAVLGRAATLAAVLGAARFTVDYSIDGVALKLVADAWPGPRPPTRPPLWPPVRPATP